MKKKIEGGEALVIFIREQVDQGVEVTGGMVAEFLGVSDRTGRRRLNDLKDTQPGLFTDQSRDANSDVSQEQEA